MARGAVPSKPHVAARATSSPMKATRAPAVPRASSTRRFTSSTRAGSITVNAPVKWSVSGGAGFSQKSTVLSQARTGRLPAVMTSAQSGCASGAQCWKCGVTRSGQYWSSYSVRFRSEPEWITTASKPAAFIAVAYRRVRSRTWSS